MSSMTVEPQPVNTRQGNAGNPRFLRFVLAVFMALLLLGLLTGGTVAAEADEDDGATQPEAASSEVDAVPPAEDELIEEPAGEPVDEPAVEMAVEDALQEPTTADAEPSPEADAAQDDSAALLDPYFDRNGLRHYFVTECEEGQENCVSSPTPITAALANVQELGLPDDGVIYIEGGQFNETLTISELSGPLTLSGRANGETTFLNGAVVVSGTTSQIGFANLVFNNAVAVVNASGVEIAQSTLNAGVSLMNSNDVQITQSELNAGTVVMNSTNLTVEESQFNAGVVLSGVDQAQITDSTLSAGVMISNSQNVTLENTILVGDAVISGSQVEITGTAVDDTIAVALEDDASAVAVNGGDGKDELKVKAKQHRNHSSLKDQAMTTDAGDQVVFTPSVESLTIEMLPTSETSLSIDQALNLSGSLNVSAGTISVEAPTVVLEGIELNAVQSVSLNSELNSDGDIILNANTGVTLQSEAAVRTEGKLMVDADLDADGVGNYVQEAGAVVEAKDGVIIKAADIFIAGTIDAIDADVQLLPSLNDAQVILGGEQQGIFSLSELELSMISTSGSLLIGAEDLIGDVSIGVLDLSGTDYSLTVFGGGITLGEILLTMGAMLNLLAMGLILDGNGSNRNIQIVDGTVHFSADSVGTTDDPIELFVDMLSAQINRVGSAFLSDLTGNDPPLGSGLFIYNETNLTISDPGVAVDGEIFISVNGQLTISAPVKASGEKTLVATSISIADYGFYSPGNSPGIDNVDTFTQGAGETLQIEIGGLTPGPGDPVVNDGYDQINVTNLATLDGTLEIVFLDGFVPSVGDTFDFMTFGSVSGSFANATGLYGFGSSSNLYFELVQQADRLQLVTRSTVDLGDFGLSGSTVADNDKIGEYVNREYFGAGSYTVDADLAVGSFFFLTGTFALSNTVDTVTLSDSSTVNVSVYSIGGSVLEAFAGLNGPADSGFAKGLSLSGVEFGFAFFKEQSGSRHWTSLLANVDSASVIGLDDVTVSGSTLEVAINLGKDATVIDFGSDPMSINTGSGSVVLDHAGSEGKLVQVSGSVDLAVAGFFFVNGSFTFKKAEATVTLDDTTTPTVNMLQMGVSGVNAFAGVNGGGADAMGLSLTGVNFALAILNDQADHSRTWLTLQADVTSAVALGIPNVTLSGSAASVEINLAASDGTVVDYAAQELAVGATIFGMGGDEGQVVRVKGDLTIEVDSFFRIEGGFAIDRSSGTVTLDTAEVVNVDRLMIGANGVNAFAGINGGTADAMGLELSDVELALVLLTDQADSTRKWASVLASAGGISLIGLDGITLSGSTINVEVNRAASDGTFVDYEAQNLIVTTGPSDTITVAMAGSEGALTKVSGALEIAVYDFFNLSGSFAIEKKSTNLTPSDATAVDVDLLTIGASGVNAFAGLNGGSADAMGLSLSGVEFGLALIVDQSAASRKWLSLQAAADSFSVLGIPDVTVGGTTLSVTVNRAASDATVIDYNAQSLVISTGPSTSITLDMAGSAGAMAEASGNLSLTVADFFTVDGGFAFVRKSEQVTLDSGEIVEADLLAVGAANVNAFAGTNGGTTDALGLNLTGVDFALIMLTDSADAARKWMALQAGVDSAALVGLTGLTIAGDTLSVQINLAASDSSLVDFMAQNLTVKTSPSTTLVMDMDGAQGAVVKVAGNLQISVADFFTLSGGFALEKYSTSVILDTAEVVSVDVLAIGAAGVNAFAGLNGGTADALGLNLSEVDFALVLLTDAADAARSWMSLQAAAGTVAFVGLDDLTISADTISVEINQAASDGSVVDYAAQNLVVTTGPGNSLTFDMNGADGELVRASGNMTLGVSSFFFVSGGFAFEKKTATVTLDRVESVNVDLLTVGGHNVTAFAGLNYGTADAVGLSLGGVDFALALLADQNDASRKWLSLSASAASFAFVGIDVLTIEGDTISVEINVAANDGSVVDYAAQNLIVATGPSSSTTLTMDGAAGELVRAAGNLVLKVADFFQVSGGFAIEKRTASVTLDDSSVVSAALLAIGGKDINAFAGLNGGTADALGLALSSVSFGLALLTDLGDPTRKWLGLKASAGSASFVGVDGLTLSGNTMSVVINHAASDGSLVDFYTQNLSVTNSPSSSITLDMDAAEGELIRAS
ncbi:MAG: DUF3737 family protein, partial [Anaerolineaceae bacterium]|nr:DUF3737 family protein [Anaerolineaceae bacterium]